MKTYYDVPNTNSEQNPECNKAFYIEELKKLEYFEPTSPHWNVLSEKTPVEVIKEIVTASKKAQLCSCVLNSAQFLSSPQHLTSAFGFINSFKYFCEKTNNYNPQNNDGCSYENVTPLHIAAWKGHTNIAKLIVENISDCNIQDSHGKTPLDIAAYHGHFEICKILVKKLTNDKVILTFDNYLKARRNFLNTE